MKWQQIHQILINFNLEDEKRKQRNIDLYGDWYKNFWPGFFKNEGGMINARPGYYGGGSATLEYTDPDLYTPTGENEYGPGSGMIKALPIGDEPSFADEFGGYDDLAMSDPDPADEWDTMYRDYKAGGGTLEFEEFKEMMMEHIDIPAAAQGGIMGYYGGGMSDMDLTRGGASFGPGTGTSDDIPAMLSDGEFVVTANAVKNLGGGNRMLGAKRMYQMMNSLDPNSQTPAEMDTTGIA